MSHIPVFNAENSSTKDKIISIIAAEKGLNTKSISNALKKQYSVNITYQAVHKTLKQMVDEGILDFDDKEYSLNKRWISQLKHFIDKISENGTPNIQSKINFDEILDTTKHNTITLTLNTRKEFDEFYFKIREEVEKRMINLPENERVVYHHIGHLYISLAYPAKEHEFIELMKKNRSRAYFFCKGDTPIDIWATKIYKDSPIKIFLGAGSEVTRLVFVYPEFILETYYSYRTLEIFNRLYNMWSIEQVQMSDLLNDLYSINDPIQVVINKDPHTLKTVRQISLDMLRKTRLSDIKNIQKIEDTITERDIKGIANLKKYLPKDYCRDSAEYIMANKDKIIIVTGFYVTGTDTVETDGLVGAILLADALGKLGSEVIFATDKYTKPILEKCVTNKIIEFPIVSWEESMKIAEEILKDEDPSLIISIERAGISSDKNYYNIRQENISSHTAKLDALFELFDKTISIADTGNEIGTGNIREEIKKENIDAIPSVTKTEKLILATTTNWGSYGLIVALSRLTGKRLSDLGEEKILKQLVDLGCVDGITKRNEMTYDSFNLEQSREIVGVLKSYLDDLPY